MHHILISRSDLESRFVGVWSDDTLARAIAELSLSERRRSALERLLLAPCCWRVPMNENAPGSRETMNWRIRSWGAFTTRKERAEPFSRNENAPPRPRAPAPGTTPLPLLARGRTPPEKDAGAPPPVASAPAALGETAGEQRGETDSDENDCADAESVDGTESSDVDGARDGRSSE